MEGVWRSFLSHTNCVCALLILQKMQNPSGDCMVSYTASCPLETCASSTVKSSFGKVWIWMGFYPMKYSAVLCPLMGEKTFQTLCKKKRRSLGLERRDFPRLWETFLMCDWNQYILGKKVLGLKYLILDRESDLSVHSWCTALLASAMSLCDVSLWRLHCFCCVICSQKTPESEWFISHCFLGWGKG